MKTNLLLPVLFCAMGPLFSQPVLQQLVIGPIVIDASRISTDNVRRMVRSASSAAFDECGCSNLLVQSSHRYKGKMSEEQAQYLKDIENMIITNYLDHKNINMFSADDQKKAQFLRSKIVTRYFYFGKLVQDPRYEDKEFALEVHILDVNTWNYAIPMGTFSFSFREIEDYNTIKMRLLNYFNEKKDRNFCIPKVFSNTTWGTVPGSEKYGGLVNPATTAPISTSENPAPTEGTPTQDDLDKVIRQLIRFEWYYPDNPYVLKAKADYIKNPASYKHYLRQKLIVFADVFSGLEPEKITKPDPYTLEIIDKLLDTLHYLIPKIEDPEQKEFLVTLQEYYFSFRK